MFNFLLHRRAKANSGWVGRVYAQDGNIFVYREGLLEGKYPVDELVLTYRSARARRDVKRVAAGIRANVVELQHGQLSLTPRPDRELQSPEERVEDTKRSLAFWQSVHQQQDAMRARRLSGGVEER